MNHMYALSYITCIDGKERNIKVKPPYKGGGGHMDRGLLGLENETFSFGAEIHIQG